jgi:hypothetical protein
LRTRLLSGVKRTCLFAAQMSASDQSGHAFTADQCSRLCHFYIPKNRRSKVENIADVFSERGLLSAPLTDSHVFLIYFRCQQFKQAAVSG